MIYTISYWQALISYLRPQIRNDDIDMNKQIYTNLQKIRIYATLPTGD